MRPEGVLAERLRKLPQLRASLYLLVAAVELMSAFFSPWRGVGLVLSLFAMSASPSLSAPLASPPNVSRSLPASLARTVLLGDSITDGLTYPLLLQQSLREAGYASPLLLNAGIGGDTAQGMSERLERDVLSRQPTTVLFSAGINDAHQKVEPADFEKSVVSVLDRLRAKNIGVVLLLPGTLRPYVAPSAPERAKLSPDEEKHLHQEEEELPATLARLDAYRAILRRQANARALPLADVPGEMQRMAASNLYPWEADGTHLNFAGYRALVRAVLDALGLFQVAVPLVGRVEAAPGLVTNWEVLPRPKDAPHLDEKSLAEAIAQPAWKPLTLPLPLSQTQPSWYWESARQRGVALDLSKTFGADHLLARASFHVDAPRRAFLNAGAGVGSLWLCKPGGQWASVWQNDGVAHGWHPSSRAQLELALGEYQLLIECGGTFFVSLSDEEL